MIRFVRAFIRIKKQPTKRVIIGDDFELPMFCFKFLMKFVVVQSKMFENRQYIW